MRRCKCLARCKCSMRYDGGDGTGTNFVPILQMRELSLQLSEVALLVSGRVGWKPQPSQEPFPLR